MALVPSRGKVYAWGLGGSGQLGTQTARSVTTPQVVHGPWITKNGDSSPMVESDSTNPLSGDFIVKHIFSGGDQCFTTVVQEKVGLVFL